MKIRLVEREEPCVLCGAYPCVTSCVTQEWPRPMTRRLLRDRILVGVVAFLSLTAMVAPSKGWSLAMALSGLACAVLYVLLRLGEMPPEDPGRVVGRK